MTAAAMSTYQNTKVLLVQWEDDDLEINEEVERLASVFSAPRPKGYNYTTERWSIPTTNFDGDEPGDMLNRRLVNFKKGATQHDLLILYYAGHGGGEQQNLRWIANVRNNSPSLNWHDLQGILIGCSADVLFIFDCCQSDLAISTRSNAGKWMFGATSKTEVATGVGYNSFTSTLTRELERCAYRFYNEGKITSVLSLHSSLNRWGRDLEHSPILTSFSEDDALPIKVVPSSIKESFYEKLRGYDTKFLIDDSESMGSESMRWTYWDIVKEAVAAIAPIAVQYDGDGVDVKFFNHRIPSEQRKCLRSTGQVMALFDRVDPYGKTPTADRLKEELEEYYYQYKQNRHIKGLNLIILTDGDPDPGQDVAGVLVEYARKLAGLGAPELQVGVQFVQIGDDQKATDFLRKLDDDLKGPYGLDRDMVDTVLWEDRGQASLHEKVLLGGILKRFDNNQERYTSSSY